MVKTTTEITSNVASYDTVSFVWLSTSIRNNTVLINSSGALHILLVLSGKKKLFWDIDEYGKYLPNWSILDLGEACSSYPTDFTRGVRPIPCNSHNDYERKRPLFDALRWGCTSVEADVWSFEGEEDLFVGHHTASLKRDRTFKSLYVEPIVEILDGM